MPDRANQVQISLYVDRETRARARAVYLATSTNPDEEVSTFGRFVERAILTECERLEQQYNNGRRWPPHEEPLAWPRYYTPEA